ncbi:hypothetical protein FNV43_RR07408 [Rhamnella rubrinervis]|uniref:Disease resistance R13L4/SHOC-2-like LRR domain-containing protein n=1 Tax=Rhamnella rubrinervis TaxID=2594499 RepID=A0A8K0MMP3_9ROSA|nr:hypothetical protein FNV43_RR07408 [Rhamnella rubrinervis]
MMDVPTLMIMNLELLSEEHCWSIFSQLAFFERNGEDRQQLEEIGKELTSKCKGLPLQAKTLGDDDGRIVGFKMHDILHDLAQFLTKNECSTMKMDKENTQPHIVEKVRHLTLLYTAHGVEFPTSMLNEGNLHSLLVFKSNSSAYALRLPHQTSSPLSYLRTLNIRECGISWLPGQLIGQLRHLRYLDLSGTGLEELPDEVCDLCNLQTLSLKGCYSLKRLPEGMGRLVNLRHLHISDCYILKGLPKGIGRLAQLQTLDTVVIPENNHEEYVGMGDLEKMNHLELESETLIWGCGNLYSSSEAEKLAGLIKRGNQVRLSLEFHLVWVYFDTMGSKDDDDDF